MAIIAIRKCLLLCERPCQLCRCPRCCQAHCAYRALAGRGVILSDEYLLANHLAGPAKWLECCFMIVYLAWS